MQALLPIHIAAGGLAIALGALALLVKKGGTIHRRGGLLFVFAMLVMGTTGSILGYLEGGPTDANFFAGFTVAYFVGTALTTVRPVSRWTRAIHVAALAIAIAVACANIVEGVEIFDSTGRARDGVPFFMPFFGAGILMLAAAGDVRILRFGMPRGGARLARHLWRMCFALFIAAGSFFSIRERVAMFLPAPFTTGPMRALPILLVLVAMFYWLWKVRRRRAVPAVVRHEAPLTAARPEEVRS
jgi:hypothetical protein